MILLIVVSIKALYRNLTKDFDTGLMLTLRSTPEYLNYLTDKEDDLIIIVQRSYEIHNNGLIT